ncbi:MAG: hypothetical protein R3E01_19955 [Pirellulaceae bacterium]|nr:hypothetical protein [Planctomycetales bacterium]
MKKVVVPAVGCVLCAVLGIGLGMYLQWKWFGSVDVMVREMAGSFAMVDSNEPAAPPIDQWQYPGITLLGSGSGLKSEINGTIVWPQCSYQFGTTPDSFQDVVRFYAERMEFENPADIADSLRGAGTASGVHAVAGEVAEVPAPATTYDNLFLADNFQPGGEGLERPLRSQCLIRRTKSYDAVVHVTRATMEEHTHIILIYTVRKE